MKQQLKKQVENVLSNYPEARNSDISLMIKIIKIYYASKILSNTEEPAILLRSLHSLPSQDNIKRIRAKFNQAGSYLPTKWEVAKRRRVNEQEWREAMSEEYEEPYMDQ